MSNRFYFDDDDSSTSSADLSTLPYPKPLTRASFLTPNFDPNTFLSTLHNRHQTLEDLRSELKQRSQDLNKELLDVVNSNYEDFLGLGRDLKGGDEKVEEVRLGLLGFKREVESLKEMIVQRRQEVEKLIEQKKNIREQILLGRGLLEVERRISELEGRLMLIKPETKNEGEEDADSDDDSGEEAEGEDGLGKLRRHAQQWNYIHRLVQKLGPEHPFLVSREERILRLKQTVILDLGSALKQALADGEDGKQRILHLLGMHKIVGGANDAMGILKESRAQKR